MSWLDGDTIRRDFFGGLAAGVVALPLALAFGVASGLGAAAGIYGAIACGILAAIFGGTRLQISGPTGPMTLVVAAVVAENTLNSGQINLPVIAGIIVLAGVFQILLGVFRAGGYIRYVPYPVISGFMTGIGLIIIIQQIFPFMGGFAPASNPFAILHQIHKLNGNINWSAAALAGAALAVTYILPRYTRAVPASLVALVLLTLVASIFKLNVHVIGEIPSGLPRLVLPSFRLAMVGGMIATAIELAFLGAIDSLLTSLVADNLTNTRHNSNRELIGQGLGNIAAGLLGGVPGAGATMRTVVNINAGGKTRLSGVFHGMFLLAVLLGGSGLVKYVPDAVLAGLLVSVGVGILDMRGLRHILKVPRSDALLMILVLVLTVFAGLIVAVTAGLILASFIFMKKLSDITAQQTTLTPLEDEPWADEASIPEEMRNSLFVKHVKGPLFFGFASQFVAMSREMTAGKLLILRMDHVSYMDQTGIYALQEALTHLRNAGLRVMIVGITVANLDLLRRFEIVPHVVAEADICESLDQVKRKLPAAVARIQSQSSTVPGA